MLQIWCAINTELTDEQVCLKDPALVVFFIIDIVYMFIALAIVVDGLRSSSSTSPIASTMNVAGATLMAAGGSAPELCTSMIGTFTESDVGFGTIVGSAVFNVLFVIGVCAVSSTEVSSDLVAAGP